jgi:hypothetical protein
MTEERLITGIEITNGSADDGKQLPKLIKQSKINGIAITEVIADTAYSKKDNLENTANEGIKLISKLHPCVSQEHKKEREGFSYNKDSNQYICPMGYTSINCEKRKSKKKNNNTVLIYSFSKIKCKKCPNQNTCKVSKKGRKISITVPSVIHKTQLEFQNSVYFKNRYRQRYMIEAKNAEAKCNHGLNKADSKGIQAMNVQSYFTAFVLNVKRIIKLCT